MDDFYGLLRKVEDDGVREWLKEDPKNMMFLELYLAELQARKGGKRKTHDTHTFEANLFENLSRLRDALWDLDYKPSRGTAHIVFRPVQREIFAAPYVDRVVHHYIVDAIMPWWDKRLCYESGSCRVGKGTSFCIERLRHHTAAVSQGFQKKTYVIKMDISGYFMHIKRDILYKRVMWGLDQQFAGNKGKRYQVLKHAIHEVIFDDPVKGVSIQGSYSDWRGLPEDKSLFCQPPGQGMVIGNLTSQFFSNIYLDVLDRFIMFDLGYKHYGRYVDDFYIVVTEDELEQALLDVKAIGSFMQGYGMAMNPKKTRVIGTWQGVTFLGAVVRDGAVLPGKRLMRNFSRSAYELEKGRGSLESVTSYLGMMCHMDAFKAQAKIFERYGWKR